MVSCGRRDIGGVEMLTFFFKEMLMIKQLLDNAARFFAAITRANGKRPSVTLAVEHLEGRDVPATLSIGSYAANLAAQIHSDATNLVRDAVAIEIARPTLLKSQISSDLAALSKDIATGNVFTVFSGAATLESELNAESSLARLERLPATAALANYIAIQGDFNHLVVDQHNVDNLLAYLGQLEKQTISAKPVAKTSQPSSVLSLSPAEMQQIYNEKYAGSVSTVATNSGIQSIDYSVFNSSAIDTSGLNGFGYVDPTDTGYSGETFAD
jgi:hypothetical protein